MAVSFLLVNNVLSNAPLHVVDRTIMNVKQCVRRKYLKYSTYLDGTEASLVFCFSTLAPLFL
jgi:hypothetical protein